MYLRQIFIACLLVTSVKAQAEELCLLPVEGGEPILKYEIRQPSKIATNPRTVPGFDGMVVHAFYRHELYEFNGRRLRKIEDEFPHSWGQAYRYGIHTIPEGDAYGFGYKPRTIYILRIGSTEWEPVDVTRGYQQALFDQGSGSVYVRMSPEDLSFQILDESLRDEADLPVWNGETTKSIRTIPEISGTLAIVGRLNGLNAHTNTLWFKPDGGDWENVELDISNGRRLFDSLDDATIELSGNILRIFPNRSTFDPRFFHVDSGKLTYAGTAPRGRWKYHLPSRTWIGWSGPHMQPITRTWFGLFDFAVEPNPPKAFIIRDSQTEAVVISGLEPRRSFAGDSVFYSDEIYLLDGDRPALIPSSEGLVTFDGKEFKAIDGLSYERLGRLPWIKTYEDQTIIQSEKGVFLLNDDFSADRVESFPVSVPWPHQVQIEYVEAWQLYLIVDRQSGSLFTSPDMKIFEEIDTTSKISAFIGSLSSPSAVLLGGADQLYTLTDDCPL